MLGYADESGEPGVKKNEHDYFVFCVVLIDDMGKVRKIEEKIAKFRKENGLFDDHEFHYVKDSKKTRLAFTKLMAKLDFEFLSIAIKKDSLRETASFANMANLVLELFEKKHLDANVIMDINPKLYKELKSQKKKYAVNLHFTQRQSHTRDLIQIADYAAAIYSRALKYPKKTSTAELYSLIIKKRIGGIEL